METTIKKKSTEIFQFWPKNVLAYSSDVNTTPNHPHDNTVSGYMGIVVNLNNSKRGTSSAIFLILFWLHFSF